MDMNRAFFLRKEDRAPRWHVIDAADKTLGRLATEVTDLLRGKVKPEFTPHTDTGDYVVVVNCEKIHLTGEKWTNKVYTSFSGWRSGLKEATAEEVFQRDPALLIQKAVKGMLPRNRLSRAIMKKLKVYQGAQHPHQAQMATSAK